MSSGIAYAEGRPHAHPSIISNNVDQHSNSPTVLRFVLLHHQVSPSYRNQSGRNDHFDLMIQSDDANVLITWSLGIDPFDAVDALATSSPQPHVLNTPATRIADHRIDYLTYEGPVSNDRGWVRRVREGEAQWLAVKDDHFEAEFKTGEATYQVVIDRGVAVFSRS